MYGGTPPFVPSSAGAPPFGPAPVAYRKPGFFERLKIGWQLTKVSLSILRQEKGLLLLPFLSFLTMGVTMVVFFLSLFLVFPPWGSFDYVAWTVGIFVLYFLMAFISTFFAAAVMGAAMIKLNGGHPTVGDGLRVASQNVGRIAKWALFSATVGMILRAIAERFGWLGRIIAGIAGFAWGVLTYLVVPVLIFERLGPWGAVKRSGSLMRRTWGEAAGGYFTMGAIFGLLALAGVVIVLASVAIGSVAVIITAFVIAAVYWLILALIASAAQGILVTALYRYATQGQVAPGFPSQLFYRTG